MGVWQMVTGRIEAGETAWRASLREVTEETGLSVERLYSSNMVESFYEIDEDCIHMVPVFVAFVDGEPEVTLSEEHSDFKWVTCKEAVHLLIFDQQKEMIKKIEKNFILSRPNEHLRIRFK